MISHKLTHLLCLGTALLVSGALHANEEIDARALVMGAYKASDPQHQSADIESMHIVGSQTIVSANLTLDLDIVMQSPDKFLATAKMGAINVRQGFDGTDAWMEQPGMGIVDMPNEMLESIKESMTIDKASVLDELYTDFKWIRKDSTHAGPADVVELTTKSGNKQLLYIDEATHLIYKTESTIPTPMGEMTIIADIVDYKDYNGMLLPTESRTSMPSGNIITKFDSYEFNVETDPAVFTRPQS